MQRFLVLAIASILFSTFFIPAALAGNVVVGVNVVGANQLNEQQQDALFDQLQQAGVTTIRTGFGEQFTQFLIRANKHGIYAVAVVYPTHLGTNAHVRPPAPSVGLLYGQEPMTDADPSKFEPWFTAQLAALEATGVRLAAIEVGNEINGPYFNGDFLPSLASGRVLGIADLNNPNDPEGRAIAASYRAYLQIVAVVKKVRDQSKVNHATPILSAGLADGGLPGKKPGQKLDGVAIPSTMLFFRQNGADNLVDGYAVHVYPGGSPAAPVSTRIDELSKDAFSLCTAYKPCWVTEWGFNNNSQTCPLNDQSRKLEINTEREAFEDFAKQKRLAAILFYSWSGQPGAKEEVGAIVRCGALTDAGKLALSPM
jgi:hypothetical protein